VGFFVGAVIAVIGKDFVSTFRTWFGIAMGIGLVGSLAFAGHGQTGLWPRWHVAADVMHLLIASVWPMGLLPFAIVLWQLQCVCREEPSPQPSPGVPGEGEILRHPSASTAEVTRITRRFSAMSLISVGLLLLSGIVNGCCLLGSFSALVNIDYGRVLLLKIALFLGMMAFAAVNRFVLMPRLDADRRRESFAARRLQMNVMIELGLMITVLLVTGLLGTLMPAQM
jgi:putative copper resistance protein D